MKSIKWIKIFFGLSIFVFLFVGIFNPERHRQSGAYAMGATHTLTQRVGRWWVTAVGEVPEATLLSFVQGLERRE